MINMCNTMSVILQYLNCSVAKEFTDTLVLKPSVNLQTSFLIVVTLPVHTIVRIPFIDDLSCYSGEIMSTLSI